nr:unnamed protein product [Digitaria exilis]
MSAATEVAPVQHRGHAAAAAWRVVAGWLGLLFQILLRIIRGTPSSWAQLLSFVGLRHPLLPVAAQAQPSPEVAFVQLPSEAPADASTPPLRRLTVVLDLDETLVCAYESSTLPATLRTQAVEAGLHCFDMECTSSEKARTYRKLCFMVYRMLKEGRGWLSLLILYVYNFREYRDHVKDLSCLSKDFQRIVLVDNNPYSFLLQPLNGIPCITFSAGQPVDDQLMGTIFPLLKHLSLQNDVRLALYETFHMPEWFQRQGIPQIEQAV